MTSEVLVLQAGVPFEDETRAGLLVDALEANLTATERAQLIKDLLPALRGARDPRTALQRLRRLLAGPRLKSGRDLEVLAAVARLEAEAARRQIEWRDGGASSEGGPGDLARPMLSAERPLPVHARRTLDATTPVVSIGTCFSTLIAHGLQHRGWNYRITEPFKLPGQTWNHASAAWGNLFTAPAIRQEIEAAFDLAVPPPLVWARGGAGQATLVDPWREELAFENAAEAQAKSESHRKMARRAFQEAELIVITLAQIETWRLRGTDFVLARRPWGLDTTLFERRSLSVEEVSAEISRAIRVIRSFNPACRFVLAASPMRLIGSEVPSEDVRVSSARALAINSAAIERVAGAESEVQVFPLAALTDARGRDAFTTDERHLSRPMYARVLGEFLRSHSHSAGSLALQLAGREAALNGNRPVVAYTPSVALAVEDLLSDLPDVQRLLTAQAVQALSGNRSRAVICRADEIMDREVSHLRQAGAMVLPEGSEVYLETISALANLRLMQDGFDRWREIAGETEAPAILDLELAYERYYATGETSARGTRLLRKALVEDTFALDAIMRPIFTRRFPPQDSANEDEDLPRFALDLLPGASETEIFGDRSRRSAIAHESVRALARTALNCEPMLARVRVLDRSAINAGKLEDGPFWHSAWILVAPDGRKPAVLREDSWPLDLERALVLTVVPELFGAATPRHEPLQLAQTSEEATLFDPQSRWWERMRSSAPWSVPS